MRVCEHLDKLLFSLLNELIQVFAFPHLPSRRALKMFEPWFER
jgi:hypothetical protein